MNTGLVYPVNERSVVLELPWPPTVNHYWTPTLKRHKRGPRAGLTYASLKLSNEGKAYSQNVELIILSKRLKAIKGQVHVHLVSHPLKYFRYDIDNFRKGIYDALHRSGLIEDDQHIVTDSSAKGIKRPRDPGYTVTITPLEKPYELSM